MILRCPWICPYKVNVFVLRGTSLLYTNMAHKLALVASNNNGLTTDVTAERNRQTEVKSFSTLPTAGSFVLRQTSSIAFLISFSEVLANLSHCRGMLRACIKYSFNFRVVQGFLAQHSSAVASKALLWQENLGCKPRSQVFA